ncbi:hypothetical protein NM688_g3532 [Phlebia brevispora]|uniref:Uncharacterized protein n=1 Tax=Phlebia brevispora TaxID=194682 RepID=A0ACC1T5P2_9APHY|nr:hypothetical protein NM688_g3532 [Phlebia brevispora]
MPFGGGAIGKKGKKPWTVGEEAAEEILSNLREGGCVDEYLQDQIIVFLALAAGRSTIRTGPLTLHTKTAMWIAEELTDATFDVKEDTDGTILLSCEGIGYTSRKAAAARAHVETLASR